MNPLRLENWKFIDRDDPDSWLKGYTDSHWNDVIVPHDWSVAKPFSRDNSSGTGYLPGGIGWYRSHFFLKPAQKKQKVFVYFDGIYKNSQIWCNSYFLGERPSGYTSFWYDITDFVRFGEEENVISVRVKHNDISDSRWFTGSGIYRKVQLLISDPVYAIPDEFFFQTVSANREQACFTITDTIANDTECDRHIELTYTLVSPSGSRAARCHQSLVIPANSKVPVTANGTIGHPDLFSCDTPNLYQVQSEITAGSYHSSSSSAVGIRSFHFDANNGFYLNGAPMKLKGVCLHHDAGVLGAAVWKTVWERRLQKLRIMGCNAIRMSHNPHMPELYDLCDELGFLVIDEAFDEWEGVKNKWSTGHNVYPPKHQGYYRDFPQWHEQDLTALVKRDRNHPCIIMWSIGNEIDYPNDPYCHPLFQSMAGNNDKNKPAEEQEYKPDKPNAERLTVVANRLRGIVKQHDTTRPVSAALAFPELSTQIGLIEQLDVAGYNYKEQWYEQDHTRFPEMPFLGSENTHTLEAWQAVTKNSYISGQFLWTGIDFLGEAEGWPVHGSNAGLLTLAGMEKIDYYRRQSFWAEEPVIYLATRLAGQPGPVSMMRKWDYPAKEMTEVVCYTNQPSAELFLNGKSLGSQALAGKESLIWSVPFEAGVLEVRSGHSVSDTLATTSCGSEITLALWESGVQDNSAYRLEQIEVLITDTNGNWVCSDNSMLSVNVSGGGSLQGLENGDTADNTDYFSSYRRAYEGRMLIYVIRRKHETIPCTVTVAGRGLKTGTLIIG